jgi:hypothetical protein
MSEDRGLPLWVMATLILIQIVVLAWALGYIGNRQKACEAEGKVLVRTTWGHRCVQP